MKNSEHYGRQNEERNPEKARESRNYFHWAYFFQLFFSQKILGRKMTMGGEDFLKAADEAFALLDVDGNGTIERGDIE